MNILEGQKLVKNKNYGKALAFFLDLEKNFTNDFSLYTTQMEEDERRLELILEKGQIVLKPIELPRTAHSARETFALPARAPPPPRPSPYWTRRTGHPQCTRSRRPSAILRGASARERPVEMR